MRKTALLGLMALLMSFLMVACGPAQTSGDEVARSEATATPESDDGDMVEGETEEDVADEVTPPAESEGEMVADLDQIRWSLVYTVVGGDAQVWAPMKSDVHFQIDNGKVSGNAGCNRLNGDMKYDGEMMEFVMLATTRMACEPELMELEMAIVDLLGQTTGYELVDGLLVMHNSDDLPLAAFTAAEVKSLFVGSEQADCVGVGPQKCLLVKDEAEGEYTYFYDSIVGFDWEAGYEYELLVSVVEINNPMLADASSLRYKLVDVVSKTAVAESEETAEVVGKTWQWLYFEGGDGQRLDVDAPEQYTLQLMADGSYALKADCNQGGGAYTLEGSSLSLQPGPITLAMCGPDSLDSEYLRRLGDVVTFVVTDEGQLVLNLMMDAGNMVFEEMK
ncbi:MAG TPA: META domain-containing protein [Anaerolineae bacterium]|nr:META domain-containing protein [Anaerolineae bacterium]